MFGEFEYRRAETVEECCALLVEYGEDTKVLAGGTDLLVAIRGRELTPRLLVDIKAIASLSTVFVDEQRGLFVGAAVDVNRVIENQSCRVNYPALVAAAETMATYQIRNRATVVGNVCNASPAADTAPPLLVHDARIVISGPEGERKLPLREFFTGVKQNALLEGEMVTGIWAPPPAIGLRTRFLKHQRIRGHDLALVNLAGSFNPESLELRIAIGSCAPTPVLLDGLDVLISTSEGIENLIRQIDDKAQASISPISDNRGSASYRREMVSIYLKRLLDELMSGIRGDSL